MGNKTHSLFFLPNKKNARMKKMLELKNKCYYCGQIKTDVKWVRNPIDQILRLTCGDCVAWR